MKYKYIGTEEQLIEHGFNGYWIEINARIKNCEYTRDGKLYEDIIAIYLESGEINVDIPRYNNEETFKEVIKDLIDANLVEVIA